MSGSRMSLVGSMLVGTSLPNSYLKQFERELADGRILVMVDVPLHRVEEVQEYLQGKHPEAAWKGVDPAVPAFP